MHYRVKYHVTEASRKNCEGPTNENNFGRSGKDLRQRSFWELDLVGCSTGCKAGITIRCSWKDRQTGADWVRLTGSR